MEPLFSKTADFRHTVLLKGLAKIDLLKRMLQDF